MKIHYKKKNGFEYAIVNNFYTHDELQAIRQELVNISPYAKPENAGPARTDDGKSLNTSSNLWLDDLYTTNRNQSAILNLNRKLFSPDLVEPLIKKSAYYGHIKYCNLDYTLINYYDDAKEYKPHIDESIFTVITFFKFGNFIGGELSFPDYDISIEPVENTMVIFTGCVFHQAHKVIAESANACRVSMVQFLGYKPPWEVK